MLLDILSAASNGSIFLSCTFLRYPEYDLLDCSIVATFWLILFKMISSSSLESLCFSDNFLSFLLFVMSFFNSVRNSEIPFSVFDDTLRISGFFSAVPIKS